jgi:hypothetical protein
MVSIPLLILLSLDYVEVFFYPDCQLNLIKHAVDRTFNYVYIKHCAKIKYARLALTSRAIYVNPLPAGRQGRKSADRQETPKVNPQGFKPRTS